MDCKELTILPTILIYRDFCETERFFSFCICVQCPKLFILYIDVRPSTPCLEAEAYGTGQTDCGTQKRFIYRLLTRHGCLPVWLVAAWYSSGSGHGPTWTSPKEMGVLKKLSLAGIAKLSRLKYRWLRFVWPEPTIGWCTQPANSQLLLQSSMKYLGFSRLSLA